jgi:hypothetical protein
VTGRDFAAALAQELGLGVLGEDEVEQLLALASTAAHSSERLAAPLCTFLAGRSGRPLAEVAEAADAVRRRA